MPIYEYLCSKCSHAYEKRQGFDASPRQKCPECGGRAQRVIQAPPIVFKGSGFYKTDSRGAPPSESESSSTSNSKSSKDSSTKDSSKDSSSGGSSSKDAEPAAAS